MPRSVLRSFDRYDFLDRLEIFDRLVNDCSIGQKKRERNVAVDVVIFLVQLDVDFDRRFEIGEKIFSHHRLLVPLS